MNKLVKMILIFSALLISFSVFYYHVIFLPQKERARIELEQQIEQAKIELQKQELLDGQRREIEAVEKIAEKERVDKLLLDICLSDAQSLYLNYWDRQCEIQERKSDCTLPHYIAEEVDGYHEELKDDCFRKYPQN